MILNLFEAQQALLVRVYRNTLKMTSNMCTESPHSSVANENLMMIKENLPSKIIYSVKTILQNKTRILTGEKTHWVGHKFCHEYDSGSSPVTTWKDAVEWKKTMVL